MRHALIALPHESVTAGQLTFSGGLITDAVREAGVQGDGLTPPAGVGIWPGATNLVTNGGFETNTTGWAGTRATVARDTGGAKFGSACMSVTSTADFAYSRYTFSGLADGTYTLSVWEKSGATPADSAFINVGDGTSDLLQIGAFASDSDWAQKSGQFTVSGSPANVFVDLYARFGGADAEVLWDGIQVEAGSIATPYIETDGGTASRVAGRVQQPVSGLLTATQGAFVARLRTGWGNGGSPGNPRVAQWRVDGSNRTALLYNTGANLWQETRVATGTGNSANTAGGTFAAGATPTVIGAWTATAVRSSLNGGSFNQTADTNIPNLAAQTTIDIGSEVGVGDFLYGNVLWYATFAGTLTDADAAYLNSYGDNPPSLDELISVMPDGLPTSVWDATTSAFAKVA